MYIAVRCSELENLFDVKHIALLKFAVQIFLNRSQGRQSVIIVAILIVNIRKTYNVFCRSSPAIMWTDSDEDDQDDDGGDFTDNDDCDK